MTTYSRWQRTIVDSAGNVQAGATVTVYREIDGALATLKADRDGAGSKSNPFTTDSNGFAFFYAAAGRYRIVASSGAFSDDWRDVPLGTASEVDLDSLVVLGTVREKLTAARTYYVRADGSDSNNGLTNTAGGAFLTIQKALDVVFGTLDLGGKNVTIQVGAGTYTGAVTASAPQVGSGTITILGDTTTPSNVYLNVTGTAITVSNYASLSVSGLKIAGTNFGIVAGAFGTITIAGKVEFAACGIAHMRALTGGQISCQGISYTISGSSQTHARADGGLGYINLFGSTATLTGSPVFSTGFAFADRLSIISAGSFSSSGSTGSSSKRYSATLNGVIYTAGGGASFFPGDTSGTTATGGQYA